LRHSEAKTELDKLKSVGIRASGPDPTAPADQRPDVPRALNGEGDAGFRFHHGAAEV
jgi:hypothetical protein